jgi:RimJ/RimL family protein N-acetyltransferase
MFDSLSRIRYIVAILLRDTLKMDYRIIKWIENASGLPLKIFPDDGVRVVVSKARTDEPKNRLRAQRVMEKNGVLVTGIPRVVEAVKSTAESLTSWELFSPFGLEEIKRAIAPEDAKDLDTVYGFDYFLTDSKDFRPVKPRHPVVALHKKDIPRGDEELRRGERRSTEKDDFTWAFTCYHNDPNVPAKTLREYGPRCASVAVIFWKSDDLAGFGVATEEGLRRQGYALDVVSTATQFVLGRGGVAWYGAYADNIPSLHIPRRLGYSLIHSSFSG